MERFTASNGHQIFERAPGETEIVDERGNSTLADYSCLDSADLLALREFFRAEEDERLGRWRWPERPDYVVYAARDGDGVHWSVNEVTGESHMNTRAGLSSDEHARAARAYFDAHPEPRDPWEDAKAGEVWVMTVGVGPEFVAYVNTDSGFPRFIDLSDDMSYSPRSGFTAGRRIYPEVAS